jgi:hypothetical protein
MHHEPAPTVSLPPEHRTRDRRIGLAMIAVAFALSIGISLWAKRVSGPEIGSAPAPASTHGIYGWPNQVDSLKTLPVARTLTPRNQLRGIIVDGSKSDGTVDLREGGEIKFMFQSSPGQGPQLPRKPGVVPKRNTCGRQNVNVNGSGIAADLDQPGVPCPGTPFEALPEPRCTLAKVWSAALKRGAPQKGRARIEYYRSLAGPAWRFEVAGAMRMNLYGDCERELSRDESPAAL